MNHEERYICNQQRKLYEYAFSQQADIYKFSYAFLRSDFCNRSLDKPYSVDQFADIVNWLEFLEKDCPLVSEPDVKRNASLEAAGWCGFTYRQLQIETRLQSREIADKVPIERLMISYPGLHTVDEEMAAEIIMEDFGLCPAISDTEAEK